ncbi:Branched-chain-amino-acid transaminase [Aphelenchoides fujianensis]|nr:Branched-chain-amino-acid transaminase [Aphelenchoides fujianensis]
MHSLPKVILGPRSILQAMIRRASSTTIAKTEPDSQTFTPNWSFYHKDMDVVLAGPNQMQMKPQNVDEIKFGHCYSDHMVEVDWSTAEGWTRPLLSPLHNFQIHPGAKVLHYAIELFEGMKAYRGVDNRIRLFRPDRNMERMRRTAARASLPDFDPEELIKIISSLIQVDKEWVPYSTTGSLYIRPTLIGTDPTLGVAHTNEAKLFVLTGPAGAYYPTGMKPVSLLADSSFIRAFPGGVGQYKMGCNYAPTILIGKRAAEMGCQQVLWLYDDDEKLTEVGTMNIFVLWKNEQGEEELLTPPLTDGLILPGVTRESLLMLAHQWGEFKVTERYPTMEEIRRGIMENRVMQMFGAGTACVVSPVGRILYRNPNTRQYEDLIIPTMTAGNVMQRLYEAILDIQYGRVEMPGWMRLVA